MWRLRGGSPVLPGTTGVTIGIAGGRRTRPAPSRPASSSSKSGGISGAREVMRAAKAHGLQVMLSCMVESQLGICQAAQLVPLADRIDLDSHLMLDSEPFRGLGLDGGRIVLTGAPGLGLTPAEPFGP